MADRPATGSKRFMRLAGMTLSAAGRLAGQRVADAFRSEQGRADARRQHATEASARIAQTLGELKGAVMKVGQMASLAGDLLPDELSSALQSLQRDAPPMGYEVIEGQIHAEFGQPVETLFSHFEREPFASASIGQVHRARTDDGREVACKVQYPGVDGAVDSDMRHLKLALRASGLLRTRREMLDATFEEISARMHEELDYCNEADNLRAFSEFHRRHPKVVIPRVVGERSAKRVLTLSYEPGAPAADLQALGYSQAERDACATQLWQAVESQAYDFGRIHADPNPANFAFRRDGSVVMYDFGCVKDLPEHLMPNYAALVLAGLQRDFQSVDSVLQRLGLRDGSRAAPPEETYAIARDWLALPFMGSECFDFGAAQLERGLLRDVMPALLPHHAAFQPARDTVFFHRALAGHYGTLRSMGATVPVQRMLAQRIEGIDALLGIATAHAPTAAQ